MRNNREKTDLFKDQVTEIRIKNIFESNFETKSAMALELFEMGLSLETIKRILHLETEELEHLL